MNQLSPEWPVYQAGTLSSNAVTIAAGLATLKKLATENFYSNLKEKTKRLVMGILSRAKAAKIPLSVNFSCGIFGLIFTSEERITRYAQVANCNVEHFRSFFHKMLDNGARLPCAFCL